MVETMRQAERLSWIADYRWEARSNELGHAIYHIWLKKPDYARIEARPFTTNEPLGILVGDSPWSI